MPSLHRMRASPAHCRRVVPVLSARDGRSTKVELSEHRVFEVLNIAWGQDDGDDYEHITINVSPDAGAGIIELFFTDEVARIVDPVSGAVLWETDGTPYFR